jgi:multiple sugar transport system permease protein
MPLVRPMSAAFCLIVFLGQWNAFFAPNVFLHSQDNLTLPVVLRLYISQYQADYGVFLAGTALAIIPPALLFFARSSHRRSCSLPCSASSSAA